MTDIVSHLHVSGDMETGDGHGVDKSSESDSSSHHHMWVEKYRPQTLDEVMGHDDLRTLLKTKGCSDYGIPNLVLFGPPGTGKTSLVWALARELYSGLGGWEQHMIYEVNASDDRGVDIVRTQLTDFAKSKCMIPTKRCRLVFMDEADEMTNDAQESMCSLMDKYRFTVRFVFAVNRHSKLIVPLLSRCSPFRVPPIDTHHVISRLETVAKRESRHGLDKKFFLTLATLSHGDMRVAFHLLQSACALYTNNKDLSPDCLYQLSAIPNPKQVDHILWLIFNHSFTRVITETVKWMNSNGWTLSELISPLHERLSLGFDIYPIGAWCRLTIDMAEYERTAQTHRCALSIIQISAVLGSIFILKTSMSTSQLLKCKALLLSSYPETTVITCTPS